MALEHYNQITRNLDTTNDEYFTDRINKVNQGPIQIENLFKKLNYYILIEFFNNFRSTMT